MFTYNYPLFFSQLISFFVPCENTISLSRQSKLPTEFHWLLAEPFNGGPISVFNFQSFPRVDPLLSRKEYITPLLFYSVKLSHSQWKHFGGTPRGHSLFFKYLSEKNIFQQNSIDVGFYRLSLYLAKCVNSIPRWVWRT